RARRARRAAGSRIRQAGPHRVRPARDPAGRPGIRRDSRRLVAEERRRLDRAFGHPHRRFRSARHTDAALAIAAAQSPCRAGALVVRRPVVRRAAGRPGGSDDARRFAPPVPRPTAGPLDADLAVIRRGLVAHRRRLWIRRITRRAFMFAAVLVASELVLWLLARVFPLEVAPALGGAMPIAGLVLLLAAATLARPTLGEAALAVDAEAHTGDRIATALSLAASVELPEAGSDKEAGVDDEAEEHRFIRRQRRDAARVLQTIPAGLFRPRVSRTPAIVALVGVIVLVPLIFLPNPQDTAIAAARQLRNEANRQADKIDEVAKDLEHKGADSNDPRTKLAQELRELAKQLRERPADLELNLATLGSVESDLRAQLDPATEQRASSLASVSRALSRAAT